MKALGIFGLAVVVAGLGYYLVSRENETYRTHRTYTYNSPYSHNSPPPDPPTTTHTNPNEVFQKAFWKRPTPADTILHAERREWADADGVDRWQWFIAVKPSPELTKYLWDENPFSLSEPSGTVSLPSDQVPEWFPKSAASFKVRHNADGGMLLMMDSSAARLYATGQGRGFSKAVEMQPAQPTETGTRIGRLPDSPPPATPEN